jgi:hypothetical protein
MLEKINFSSQASQLSDMRSAPSGKSLVMVKNERTAGFIPKWEDPSSFSSALALHETDANYNLSTPGQPEEFGFADLFDMVNPLQHIPVVSYVYREISGDEIKPISQIIGGVAFGGAIGAATSFANVIAEEETGKDMAGNVLAIAFNNETKSKSKPVQIASDEPQFRLSSALINAPRSAVQDLPGTTLAFADLSGGTQTSDTQFANLITKLTTADEKAQSKQIRSYNA